MLCNTHIACSLYYGVLSSDLWRKVWIIKRAETLQTLSSSLCSEPPPSLPLPQRMHFNRRVNRFDIYLFMKGPSTVPHLNKPHFTACFDFRSVCLLHLYVLSKPFGWDVILHFIFGRHLVGCTHLFYLTFHPSSSACHTPVLFNPLFFIIFVEWN